VATRGYYQWNTFSDSENDTTTQTVGITASMPLSTDNTVTLGYEYLNSWTKPSGDQTSDSNQTFQGTQNVSGHQILASFGRRVNSLLTAGIEGTYAFRIVDGGDSTDSGNFRLWNASLYGTYGTSPFTVTGKVGLSGLSDDSGESRGPDFTFSTTASYAFPRAAVSITLEHGFSETFGSGQNFGVVETTGASATLSYPFTTRMNGEVNAYYRKTETTGIGGGQSISGGPNIGSNSSDVEESVGAAATLRMRLLRWLSATLTYTYTHRFDNGNTATNGSFDNSNAGYTENRVRLGFDISF
jgi:hypothetical protein